MILIKKTKQTIMQLHWTFSFSICKLNINFETPKKDTSLKCNDNDLEVMLADQLIIR